MAEAQAIAVPQGSIPPLPPSANVTQHSRETPPANMQPGFAPPPSPPTAPQGYLSPEQVQVEIQKALAAAKSLPETPPKPEVPPTPAEAAADLKDAAGNDPVLASLTDVFLNVGVGVDMERALGKALAYGDVALIDLAYIQEKGGAHAAQLSTLAKAIVERVETQTLTLTKAVFDAAGGKTQWDAAAAVFDKQAPQYLKAVIAKMLDSGNPQTVREGAQAVIDYTKQSGLVPNPGQFLDAGATSASAAQAMSKAEFQQALFSLDKNSRTYQQDRDALFARRQLGKQLGR